MCISSGCDSSGGTSASAPVIAALITLINDVRLNNGLKPLGYMTHRLYNAVASPSPEVPYNELFLDVVTGNTGDDCQALYPVPEGSGECCVCYILLLLFLCIFYNQIVMHV